VKDTAILDCHKERISVKNKIFIPIVLCVCFVLLLSSIFVSGITWSSDQNTTWEWPRSTPEEQGLDSKALTELVEIIREGQRFPRLHSLLLVRNGQLVLEEYFGSGSPDRIHTLQSVSKSFTSALVGIAIERDELKGVDEKLLDFFPDKSSIENLDERKKAITLQDLLTMRSGTDYNESGSNSPHHQLNRLSAGWDKRSEQVSMRMCMPGSTFFPSWTSKNPSGTRIRRDILTPGEA
jgi:CubicO group peptidase (beta-lactamase class C family)